VKTGRERPLVFDDVVARVREDFALDLHLDTDEANAAGLKQGDMVTLLDDVATHQLSGKLRSQ